MYAPVRVELTPLPARFTAALPSSVAELEQLNRSDPRFAPRAHVVDALCGGDAAMIDRAVKAAARADDGGAVARGYGRLVEYCVGDKSHCESAKALIARTGPARILGFHLLRPCRDASLAPLFDAPDVPADAVVQWYLGFYENRPPYAPRFGDAVLAMVEAPPDAETPLLLRSAAYLLARYDHPHARSVLDAMLAKTSGEIRQSIVAAMAPSEDPSDEPEADPPAPTADEHERCVRDSDESDASRARCLHLLAELAPERAKALAASLEAAAGPLRVATRTVMSFGSLEELVAELRKLDLVSGAIAPSEDAPPHTVADVLGDAGKVHHFDPETGQFPNEHDSLLRSLAALAGGKLADVVFAETAPVSEMGSYLIHAYADGRRYTVTAKNNGDWYDLDAAIGLMNELARARDLPIRYALLGESGGNDALIVGANGAPLQQLVSRGLIELGDGGDAVDDAKAREADIIRRLQDDELR